MRDEAKRAREAEILDAALEVLAEDGWSAATMNAIRIRASASKETLYAWFGDRAGLYAALVRRNAAGLSALVEAASARKSRLAALAAAGEALLAFLLSPASLALNRAAIADESGELGGILLREGREALLPKLAALAPQGVDGAAYAADWLALLKGETQLSALLGATEAVDVAARARRATRLAEALHAAANPAAAG